jgi:hypothetical protein
VDAAITLLRGIRRQYTTGKPTEFLTANTKQEGAARAALSRVLMHENVPRIILYSLAHLFDPDPDTDRRKLVFQDYLNQGRHDPDRDAEIEYMVDSEIFEHRMDGKKITQQQAYEIVAKEVKLSAEQVRRIYKGYGKRKRKLKK